MSGTRDAIVALLSTCEGISTYPESGDRISDQLKKLYSELPEGKASLVDERGRTPLMLVPVDSALKRELGLSGGLVGVDLYHEVARYEASKLGVPFDIYVIELFELGVDPSDIALEKFWSSIDLVLSIQKAIDSVKAESSKYGNIFNPLGLTLSPEKQLIKSHYYEEASKFRAYLESDSGLSKADSDLIKIFAAYHRLKFYQARECASFAIGVLIALDSLPQAKFQRFEFVELKLKYSGGGYANHLILVINRQEDSELGSPESWGDRCYIVQDWEAPPLVPALFSSADHEYHFGRIHDVMSYRRGEVPPFAIKRILSKRYLPTGALAFHQDLMARVKAVVTKFKEAEVSTIFAPDVASISSCVDGEKSPPKSLESLP